MSEGFRVAFLRADGRIYVDVMALEVGMRDHADDLADGGRNDAAYAIMALCDSIWDAVSTQDSNQTKGDGAG